MNNDKIEKMLRALLNGRIQWVGGYVRGCTSNNDPFVVLYPSSEKLNFHICRVYDHGFKKLPSFINTDNIATSSPSETMSKDKAQKKGIYHECPAFSIITEPGKDTQMGPEVRFSDVLDLSKAAAAAVNQPRPAKLPTTPKTSITPPQTPPPPPTSETTQPKAATWQQKAYAARDKDELAVAIAAQWYESNTAIAGAAVSGVINGTGYKPESRYNVAVWAAVEWYRNDIENRSLMSQDGIISRQDKVNALETAREKYKLAVR